MSREIQLAEQQLKAVMEAGRPVSPKVGISSHNEDGFRYVTFSMNGVKSEGALVPPASTLTEAIQRFLVGWKEYVQDKGGWALHWRQYPHVEYVSSDQLSGLCAASAAAYVGWHIFARAVLTEIKEQ